MERDGKRDGQRERKREKFRVELERIQNSIAS